MKPAADRCVLEDLRLLLQRGFPALDFKFPRMKNWSRSKEDFFGLAVWVAF